MGDLLLPDGSVYRFDGDAGVWRHVPDVDTANALGVDWNNLQALDDVPGPVGDEWPSVASASPVPPATSGEPVPPPAPAPSTAAPSQSFTWGGRTWGAADLSAFIAYLAAHGVDYSTWAANHEAAAAILEGPPTDPSREAMPKSLGEALNAYIGAGATPAEAAAQAEALRAALVKEGVSGVTPDQLLEDARVIKQTLDAEQGAPPPEGQPSIPDVPVPSGRSLQSVDTSRRDLADLRNLPPIPAGFRTIANGQVTEGLIVAAALIEHADLWVTVGTCKAESGFSLEEGRNSAGAVGPMQVVGYPPYDGSIELVPWAWGNLITGARMLANYGNVWDGDQQKMSAAYNAGPGSVSSHWPGVLQWLEVKGHPEAGTVQDYVDKVAAFADQYARRFGGGWNLDPDTGQLVGGKGPSAAIAPPTEPPDTPAGVVRQWRSLVDVFKHAVPARRAAVDSLTDQMLDIFK